MLQVDFIPIDNQNHYSGYHRENTADTVPNPTNASYSPFISKYPIHKPYKYISGMLSIYYKDYMKYLIYIIKQDQPIIIQI